MTDLTDLTDLTDFPSLDIIDRFAFFMYNFHNIKHLPPPTLNPGMKDHYRSLDHMEVQHVY